MIELSQQEQDGTSIVKVRGEIDLYSSPKLREALIKAIGGGKHSVAVDLSEVGYMDSSGVATLVEGLKACGKKKTELLLLAPASSVLKVLQLSRLDTVFKIVEQL